MIERSNCPHGDLFSEVAAAPSPGPDFVHGEIFEPALTLLRGDRSEPPFKSDRRLDSFGRWLPERRWNRRATTWDHEGSVGLERVIKAVLNIAEVHDGTVAVDLGCGTGQLSLPLAQGGARVTAVDLSPAMVRRLEEKAAEADLETVVGVVSSVEAFDLPSESVDLVVSNYALHHLRDRDKEALVREVARWLRPGGRLVIGDMMFGRGTTAHDRAIIMSKVAVLARRGPAGWWRLTKNVCRFGLRIQERPVSAEIWRQYFDTAGFRDVSVVPVISEAAVVVGTKP
ncbi:MAG TPA: methyltransferase domain-containing protein [Acidimicrobiales bacterium]|nr:methyltransferase domain-containing protein [Acidimicrobiales bacterium]